MRRWLILIAVVAGLMMDLMDLTIVNVAVPDIMTGFGADIRVAQYVITAYMITIGLFEPITAYLADTRGTRRIYLVSLMVFTLGSVLCALSWNIDSLILFRVIQAIGGGMIMPLALSIVQKTFSSKELPVAMAAMGIPLLLAPALGPTVGGYLIEHWNWRFIFWLNVPVGIGAIAASRILLAEFETVAKRLDTLGFVLSAVGFATLLLAVSNGASDGWGSFEIVSLFVVATASLVLFAFVEYRCAVPLLDLRILKNRQYTASIAVMFFVMMAMFGSLFLIPLFMQQLRGLGAMQTGMLLIPEIIGGALALPISGFLLSRVGVVPLTLTGLLVMLVGMYPFHQLEIASPIASVELQLFIVGAGLVLGLMPSITTAYASLSRSLVNQGSAFLNMMRQVGSALGVAILTSVVQHRSAVYERLLSSSVTPASPAGQFLSQLSAHLQGMGVARAHETAAVFVVDLLKQHAGVLAFQDAFLTSALLGVLAILPTAFLLRRTRAGAGSASRARPADRAHTLTEGDGGSLAAP